METEAQVDLVGFIQTLDKAGEIHVNKDQCLVLQPVDPSAPRGQQERHTPSYLKEKQGVTLYLHVIRA